MDENTNSILHLIGDLSCKNMYGLILWATTWGMLNGKWDREYARNRDANGMLMEVVEKDQKAIAPPKEDFEVKVFGTTIASVRRSIRRPRADSEFVDRKKIKENKPGNRRCDYSVSDSDSDDYSPRLRGDTREDSRRDRVDSTRGYYDATTIEIMTARCAQISSGLVVARNTWKASIALARSTRMSMGIVSIIAVLINRTKKCPPPIVPIIWWSPTMLLP